MCGTLDLGAEEWYVEGLRGDSSGSCFLRRNFVGCLVALSSFASSFRSR